MTNKERKHPYNKKNCDSLVRKVYINKYGDIFTLQGTYGFEWSIVYELNNSVTKITYSNRQQALKEYNKLIKQY